jgi:hypothetical protein
VNLQAMTSGGHLIMNSGRRGQSGRTIPGGLWHAYKAGLSSGHLYCSRWQSRWEPLTKKETEPERPCAVPETASCVCTQVFSIGCRPTSGSHSPLNSPCLLQGYLVGRAQFQKNRWLLAYLIGLIVSLVDWTVSLSFACQEVGGVAALRW